MLRMKESKRKRHRMLPTQASRHLRKDDPRVSCEELAALLIGRKKLRSGDDESRFGTRWSKIPVGRGEVANRKMLSMFRLPQ